MAPPFGVRPDREGVLMALVEVKDLQVDFRTDGGVIRAVRGVSFKIEKGKTLGVVGESGCGKSVSAKTLMRLVRPPGRIVGGSILFKRGDTDVDLVRLEPMSPEIRRIRGNEIAMIFQEPMTSLNPVHTIGKQIMEPIMLHQKMDRAAAAAKAVAMLEAVGIPSPKQRLGDYPHQLSGGMRQRVMIAMALSCNPELLIADEPTTALDVTIQAQVLSLMNGLRSHYNSAILFITHDLGVVAQMADDVVVMYLGKVVESAPVTSLFDHPKHPYTQGLMGSIPSLAVKKGQRLVPIVGAVPSPMTVLPGCSFEPRCPHAMPKCRTHEPPLQPVADGHHASCWLLSDDADAALPTESAKGDMS